MPFAFYAYTEAEGRTSHVGVLGKFDKVISAGEADTTYDVDKGVFTVPRSGVYEFEMGAVHRRVGAQGCDYCQLVLSVYVNGAHAAVQGLVWNAVIYPADTDYLVAYTMLELEEGDTVQARVVTYRTNTDVEYGNGLGYFSGRRVMSKYAFCAYRSDGKAKTTTGIWKDDEWDKVRVDVGGCYDTSTSTFTAKEDGVYEFKVTALHRHMSGAIANDNQHYSAELAFYKNDALVGPRGQVYTSVRDHKDHDQMYTTIILKLTAGDKINVGVSLLESLTDVYYGTELAHFSGEMLGTTNMIDDSFNAPFVQRVATPLPACCCCLCAVRARVKRMNFTQMLHDLLLALIEQVGCVLLPCLARAPPTLNTQTTTNTIRPSSCSIELTPNDPNTIRRPLWRCLPCVYAGRRRS